MGLQMRGKNSRCSNAGHETINCPDECVGVDFARIGRWMGCGMVEEDAVSQHWPSRLFCAVCELKGNNLCAARRHSMVSV
jgi:hypothetical protein